MNGSINICNTRDGVYINGVLYQPGVYHLDGNRYEVSASGVVCSGAFLPELDPAPASDMAAESNNPWTYNRAAILIGGLLMAAFLAMC